MTDVVNCVVPLGYTKNYIIVLRKLNCGDNLCCMLYCAQCLTVLKTVSGWRTGEGLQDFGAIVTCVIHLVFVVYFQMNLALRNNRVGLNCDICGKRFYWRGSLRRHRLSHDGVYSYNCTTCGKGFTSWDALDGHSAKHNQLKRYSCSKCEKMFWYRSSALKHEKSCQCHREAFS